MPPKEKYSDPKLRDEIKEEVKESDKGGAPGQWSARKAQFMASEYKKRGGGYNEPKSSGQDESQKNLSKWGEEEWQIKEGSGTAKQENGNRKRYLPKKAWEEMSDKEKQETEEMKEEGGKEGKQFVSNTDTAKEKRRKVHKEEHTKFEKRKESENRASTNGKKEDGEVEKDEKQPSSGTQKRARTTRSSAKADKEAGDKEKVESQPAKKQKTEGKEGDGKKTNGTVGSKHDKADAPAAQGSNKRLPKKGQKVQWNAMPGWVKGEVVEILKENKKVDGKDVKATKDDPRFVLKSDSSGKACIHKPDNIYFD